MQTHHVNEILYSLYVNRLALFKKGGNKLFTLDNGNCPPDYVNIMNRCFWLLCDRSNPTDAEYGCSEKFGTLASLDEIGLTRIAAYLNFTQAINSGVTEVGVISYVSKYVFVCEILIRKFVMGFL